MALEFSIEIDDKGTPKLKKFQKEVANTGKKSISASKAIGATATAATAVGVAMAGAITGAFTFANSITESTRELENLARVAGTTPEDFNRLAVGAERVGIENEKLADIFKDTNDKIGDFLSTGGGAAADFFENIAPQIGITADEFANLSGPQALQKYYSALEQSNLSQSEMTFYMEAIASDATALIPLLKENGKQFENYGDQAERAGAIISKDLIKATQDYENSVKDLETTTKGILNDVAKDLLPAMAEGADELKDAFQVAGPAIKRIVEGMIPGLLKITGFIADAIEGAGLLADAWDSMGDPKISVVTEDIEKQAKAIARINTGLEKGNDVLAYREKLQRKIFKEGRELGLKNEEIKRQQSIALIKQYNEMKKIAGLEEWTINKLNEKIEAERQNVIEINNKLKLERESAKAASKAEKDKAAAAKAEKDRLKQAARDKREAAAQAKKDKEQALKDQQAAAKKLIEDRKKWEDARVSYEKKLADEKAAKAQELLDKQKAAQEELTFFLMTEEEKRKYIIEKSYNERVKLLGQTTEVEKARLMEIAELEEELAQQRRDRWSAGFEEAAQFASIASGLLQDTFQREQNYINQGFDERKRKIEETYSDQIKAAEGNAQKEEELARRRDEKLKALDLKRERDLEKAAKRTANARKRAAQLEAIVNTAAAVTKALPNIPLSVAVGLQGASQVALIESQQFFKGGMAGQAGQQNISVGENGPEFIVSAGGTRAAGEEALQDINNGRLEDAANRLLNASNQGGRGVTIQISGGIIDEQFMENSLIPRLKQYERRL